ncbi:MAG: hypothetical protein J3R72DRAFT_426036 [Linnemannia gamsii]|nr:MAG: hypothetical protein J3R72DRAFT_426036 [Linnemannia gamsii]
MPKKPPHKTNTSPVRAYRTSFHSILFRNPDSVPGSAPQHMESLASSGHLGGQDVESTGDDKSVSSMPIRRRNKFLSLFRSSSSELKVKIKPQSSSPKAATHCQSSTSTTASVHRLTTASTHHNIQAEHAVANPYLHSRAFNPVVQPPHGHLHAECQQACRLRLLA